MIPATEALERLQKGNARFVSADQAAGAQSNGVRSKALPVQQAPFAIILGCSDSRVPAEIVFDQGLGDLFVIRVAGNIVAPSQVGSVEFAVERYSTRGQSLLLWRSFTDRAKVVHRIFARSSIVFDHPWNLCYRLPTSLILNRSCNRRYAPISDHP